MKGKTLLVMLLFLMPLIIFGGVTTGYQQNLVTSSCTGPFLAIHTDQFFYQSGEPMVITYTNIGDGVAGFVIGTARPVIPWIIQVSTGKPLYLTDPLLCYPAVMMYGVLEPGEQFMVEWDQQYYGYSDATFTPSEQVPPGLYFIEQGYWEVTEEYDTPYMVPGGPPDRFAKTGFFICGFRSHRIE